MMVISSGSFKIKNGLLSGIWLKCKTDITFSFPPPSLSPSLPLSLPLSLPPSLPPSLLQMMIVLELLPKGDLRNVLLLMKTE